MRSMLAEIDKGIKVPMSLSGDVLRHKLDEVPAQKAQRPFAFSRVFSFQSVASYAVMFAIMVAVAYAMRFNHQAPLVEGQFAVPDAIHLADPVKDDFSDVEFFEEPAEREVSEFNHNENDTIIIREQALEQINIAGNSTVDIGGTKPEQTPAPIAHTGGGEQANPLGTYGDYQLLWRENDPNDLDNGEFPVSLEIIGQGNTMISQTNIADMDMITDFLVDDDVLVIFGSNAGQWTMNAYAGFSSEQLALMSSLTQPGGIVSTRMHQGVVYAASYAVTAEPGVELVTIPESHNDSEGICYIGAIDVKTGETNLIGFEKASRDIMLLDKNVYVSLYSVDSPNGSKVDKVASIALNGISIEFEGIH